jgi:hypothetical protein
MRRGVLAATGVATCVLTASIAAHIRLNASGVPLAWQSPSNISIVINAVGSDNLSDDSHFTALRNAFDEWNGVQGSNVQFVEDTTPAEQQRTDWDQTDIHLILFDEDDSSGFFPLGSATVALTPVLFNGSGRILDADVLFNGRGFDFSTSKQPGFFDVQDVGTHELGHFLGLDHTGVSGATMYPFVSAGMILQRSLGLDDSGGMRDAYPAGSPGTIVGTVKRASNMATVAGAFVVARDPSGYTVASALADASGGFRIEGLLPDTYTVYATPLDVPVSNANLQAGHTVEVDFGSTVGGPVAVGAGQTIGFGDLLVGADVAVSLGSGGGDPLPVRAVRGVPTGFKTLLGSSLAGVSLAASDPSVTVNVIGTTPNSVTFTVTAPGGATPGHVDLVATQVADVSILPAGIEITPPDPSVSSVVPSAGADVGGTALTITGTGFRAGARVVIGQGIYVDGIDATVVGPNTITLATAATMTGNYDVVVIDPTGVEGRGTGAYSFISVPSITSVFPSGGNVAGGTQVTISGQDFTASVILRIDGVQQSNVVRKNVNCVLVTTDPGAAGGPYVLELENTGGGTAMSGFTYSNDADPVLSAVSPNQGKTTGGKDVTLTGSGFLPSMQVVFGADPATGLGGAVGTAFMRPDSSTILITTPSFSKGPASVMVRNPATGQASLLPASFSFKKDSGGGGGCYTQRAVVPWDGRSILAGTWWILLALLAVRMTTGRRARPRTA